MKIARTLFSIITGFVALSLIVCLCKNPVLLAIPVLLYLSYFGGEVILGWFEFKSGRKFFGE